MSSGNFLSSPDLLFRNRMTADTNRVKADLQKATREATSMTKSNRVEASNGDTSRLMSLERGIRDIEARAPQIGLAQSRATVAQNVFETILSVTEALPAKLSDEARSPVGMRVTLNGLDAEAALRHAVDSLNAQVAGRSVFGGALGPGAAFAPADDMIAAVKAVFNAAPDVATALADVDAIFAGTSTPPAPSFDGDFFLGPLEDAPAVDLGLERLSYAPRGDSQATRDVLKGLALAAALPGTPLAAGLSDQNAIYDRAAEAIEGGRDLIAAEQARLGLAEARMDEILARDAAERTTLTLSRASMIGLDEYEAATAVRELENRLNMIYAITSRTAALTFASFLR